MVKEIEQGDVEYGCIVVAVSTHGGNWDEKTSQQEPGREEWQGMEFHDRVDVILGIDGPLPLEDITDAFNDEHCPALNSM